MYALLLLSLLACTGDSKDTDGTSASTEETTEGSDTTDEGSEGTDADSDTTATEGTEDGTDGTSIDDDTDGTDVDTDSLSTCDGITAQYEAIVATVSCSVPDDCQALSGQCWTGLGGCYEIVNKSVDASDLEILGQAYADAGCGGGACKCTTAPAVTCINDVCVVAP